MNMRIACLAALLCMVALGADEAPNAAVELAPAAGTPVLSLASSATDVLRVCRAMLPRGMVELKGSMILRNRKGIVASEHDYRLVMRRSAEASQLSIELSPRGETNMTARVTIARRGDARPEIRLTRGGAETEVVDSLLARVLETDVTWLDLTFDYLWWPDPFYETEREGESVHGQVCSVILVKPAHAVAGLSAVRLWVDKKTGCLMQIEQVGEDGKPIRRMWGTRVKKFDGKWMVSVLEVETLGSRHRTKITVDAIREIN